MEFLLIRTIFLSLLSFDFLDSIKVLHIPLNFPWLVLFLISFLTWAFWEYFAYSVLNYKFLIIGVTDTADDLLFDFLGAATSILVLTAILKKKGYFSPSSIDSKMK